MVSLAQMRCPKAFIGCVLLVMWSTDVTSRFQLVELFAGRGQVGAVWRENGRSAGQYDWDYSRKGMDFLGNGGFASAIYMALCAVPLSLWLMGPDCGPWTVISRGTSWRNVCNFWGNLNLEWINGSNCMISRLTLLLYIGTALRCTWLLEQPAGSQPVFARHHRFEHFCNTVAFVWRQRFWMQHFGAPSAKPTACWGNDPDILHSLDKGVLKKTFREEHTSVKTTRKYNDKKTGKSRFQGTPELKSSQCYPRGLGEHLLRVHDESKAKPGLDMRQKALIDPMLTDLQIFRSLELDDPWVDAKIPSLYLYLMKNPRLSIPDEWQAQMELLRSELENYVMTEESLNSAIQNSTN